MPTIHPRTVHFPIALLTLSFGLDFVYNTSHKLPNVITSALPPSTDLTRASYFLLSAGLIMMIPALITGIREAVVLIAKQGMYESDATGDTVKMRPKVAAMIIHALFNDVVLAVSTYIWLKKRNAAKYSIPGKLGVGTMATGAAAFAPENWMVYTEIPMFLLTLMATNIGHVLVLNFGIGFSAGGGSAGKKKQ